MSFQLIYLLLIAATSASSLTSISSRRYNDVISACSDMCGVGALRSARTSVSRDRCLSLCSSWLQSSTSSNPQQGTQPLLISGSPYISDVDADFESDPPYKRLWLERYVRDPQAKAQLQKQKSNFVRIGRSAMSVEEILKRDGDSKSSKQKSNFVRIGRVVSQQHKNNFVRIGRPDDTIRRLDGESAGSKTAKQKSNFVRIGRDSVGSVGNGADDEDLAQQLGLVLDSDQEMSSPHEGDSDEIKRASAYVRIGKKAAPASAYVRVGKSNTDSEVDGSIPADRDEHVHSNRSSPFSDDVIDTKRASAYVRIGKAVNVPFVRIGKSSTDDALDFDDDANRVYLSDEKDSDAIVKRPSGYVRIGRARDNTAELTRENKSQKSDKMAGNFVRIG